MTAFAQLKSIDDPRDNLDKARLHELIDFARRNGITTLNGKPVEDNPAILIRRELRQQRLTNIRVPHRPLGGVPAAPVASDAPGIDAADDMLRQMQTQKPEPPRPAPQPAKTKAKYPNRLVERPKQEINVLRDKCKELGIPMSRRDRLPDLKAKIEAHGQNSAQLRQ
jgi:hypothetical protein